MTNRHGHIAGSPNSRWLSAKLYSHPDRHDEFIARHLPRLLAALDGEPTWWFVRYRSPHEADLLRLRLHVQQRCKWGELAVAVGEWADQLRHDGIASRLTFDTYYPRDRPLRVLP